MGLYRDDSHLTEEGAMLLTMPFGANLLILSDCSQTMSGEERVGR
jgi:hypothetical protein